MYDYRNRYYSPALARFISEDPIGWASGQTNAYAYVGGNPVQFNDLRGTDRGRPFVGVPGSWYVHPITGDRRFYGPDGNPGLDMDVSHSHDGMCPHSTFGETDGAVAVKPPFDRVAGPSHGDNVNRTWKQTVTEGVMDIFFAKTRAGVERFIEIKSKILDAELWVNGGVDLEGINTLQHAITTFNICFDMSKGDDLDAALGTIEEHYEDCKIWIEGT